MSSRGLNIKVGQVWLVRFATVMPPSAGLVSVEERSTATYRSIKIVAVEADKSGAVKVKGVERWKHGAWYLAKSSNFVEVAVESLICAVPDVE